MKAATVVVWVILAVAACSDKAPAGGGAEHGGGGTAGSDGEGAAGGVAIGSASGGGGPAGDDVGSDASTAGGTASGDAGSDARGTADGGTGGAADGGTGGTADAGAGGTAGGGTGGTAGGDAGNDAGSSAGGDGGPSGADGGTADGGAGGTGSGILFAMNYSDGAAPQAGWGSAQPDGNQWTRARIVGAGPRGQAAYRITQNAVSTPMFGGDFYYGWAATQLLTLQPAGQSRFYRLRWKFSPTTDFDGRDQNDGSPGNVHRNKLIIIGDNTTVGHSRVIPGFQGTPSSPPSWNMVISKGGGDDPVTTGEYTTLGVWHDIQIEVRYSSSLNATNGYYKLWIDTNDYTNPTAQRTAIVVNRPNTNTLVFGYMNNGIASGTQQEFEHCDFQIASEFDANWH